LKKRRNAIGLGASIAAHLALLAVWISSRPEPPAEAPALQVQLLRLAPKPPPPPAPRDLPRPPARNLSRPFQVHRPPPLPLPTPPLSPSDGISPEWRVKPGGADLDAEPFVQGRAGLNHARNRRTDCTLHGWERPLSCPPDAAELAASRFDPAKDAKTGGFAGEGARKLTMKAYRESPSTADYPGIRCSIFHKC
jgi:hypothetical protein